MPPKNAAEILEQTRLFLESRGIDTAGLAVQAKENRKARRYFSKPLGEGINSKFKTVPEGNQEFRAVGRGLSGQAPRCQARSRRSGFQQCNAVAKDGFRVCVRHGAKSHGTKTKEGIARSAAHLLVDGQETRESRQRRSQAAKLRKLLKGGAPVKVPFGFWSR